MNQCEKIFNFFESNILYEYWYDFLFNLFVFYFNKNLFKTLPYADLFDNVLIFCHFSKNFKNCSSLSFDVLNGHKFFGFYNFNIENFFLKSMEILHVSKFRHVPHSDWYKNMIDSGLFCHHILLLNRYLRL